MEGRRPAAPKHILGTQPGHTSQSPEPPGREGKRTQVTSWFKSFDLGREIPFISAMKPGTKAGTKVRCTNPPICIHPKDDRGGESGLSGFQRPSPGLPASPRSRRRHRLQHAEPRPPRAGATSGSGRRSERGGGAARAGLDNREAPARRLGRQVGPSLGPAGLQGCRPVARLEARSLPAGCRGEEKGTDRWGGRQRRGTDREGREVGGVLQGREPRGGFLMQGQTGLDGGRLSAGREGLRARWQSPCCP